MSEQNSSNHSKTSQESSLLSDSPPKTTILSKKKIEYLNFLRSKERERLLQKKRIVHQEDTFGQGVPIMDHIYACFEKNYTLEQLPELVGFIYSPNRHRVYDGMIGILQLLSGEVNPRPIQQIIETGILPQIVGFLGRKDEIQLQLQAAAILTNLASETAEQKKEVIENGAISGLIKLLESQVLEIGAQAACALGNIAAAQGVDFRDMVLQEGAVEPLIKMMEKGFEKNNMEAIKQGNRTLSYLCQEMPLPPYEEVKDSTPIFAQVVMSHEQEDVGVLEDSLCALVYLSGGDKEKVQEKVQRVIDTGVVPFVVKLLDQQRHSEARIVSPCIQIIGLLFRGSHREQIDYLLAIPGILEKIFYVLKHQQISIRRDAAATLTNLVGRHPEHRDHIVLNTDFLDQILFVGINDMHKVREEMTWVINHLLNEPTPEQWRILLEKKIFEHLEKLLEDDEDEFIQEVGIRGIKVILDLDLEGLSGDLYREKLQQNEKALSVIGELKSHRNSEIAEIARQILGAGHKNQII